MSNNLIQLLNDKKDIKDIKLEYSYKLDILCLIIDEKLYIIDNITDDPKIRKEIDINKNIIKIILNPNNENQLIMIDEDSIYIIPNLAKFSSKEDIHNLNISYEDVISVKFSYFNNCFGVLYKDMTFIYYLLKDDNNLEEICTIKDLDKNYVDFNFCPIFTKGFETFMIFFMTKDGMINMYGPFFPNEFLIPKEYFFNMDNYLIYKLSLMGNDAKDCPENTIYCLSLKVIEDLKKSKIEQKSDRDNDFIKISEKMKIFNSNSRKREIKIHNNFLVNSGSEIFNKKYKQMHILNKKPLTIMRISEKNDIDIIMLGEEIMPLELAQTGNFTFNVENNNNNFFIEYISLNCNVEEKEKVKIFQYINENIFIRTKNSLFLIKIPYLNNMKTIAEEQIKDLGNKMKRTTIIKLFKWNNKINNNATKSINIKDILVEPNNKKLYIFGFLTEKEKKEQVIIKNTLKIKEMNFVDEKTFDLSRYDNILNEKTEYDNQINEIKCKLNENEFIDSTFIKKANIVVDETMLNNKRINFENKLNNDMNIIYNSYQDIIKNNDEVFEKKINIMKNIYNNLAQSQIKLTLDNTLQKIKKLKDLKDGIVKKKKIIQDKIKHVKDKMNNYEVDEEDINNYLKILEDYQIKVEGKINEIDSQLNNFEKNIDAIFFFTKLFPRVDLDFNLIEKENQEKYLAFVKNVSENSKNMEQFNQSLKK